MSHSVSTFLQLGSNKASFEIREIAAQEEQAAATARWPLLHAVTQTLVAAERTRARAQRDQAAAPHPVVAARSLSDAG